MVKRKGKVIVSKYQTPTVQTQTVGAPTTLPCQSSTQCVAGESGKSGQYERDSPPDAVVPSSQQPLKNNRAVEKLAASISHLNLKQEEVETQFQRMALRRKFQVRPGLGTLGKRVPLLVNYFQIKVGVGRIFHYDVVVESGVTAASKTSGTSYPVGRSNKIMTSTDLNFKILKTLVDSDEKFRGRLPVYDGQKNLFTSQPLDFGSVSEWVGRVVITNNRGEAEQFLVRIKHAATINIDPTKVPEDIVVHTLELIFRYGPRFAAEPKICVGASVFSHDYLRARDLGGNMKLAFGYSGNVRPTRSGLVINIDRAATVFHVGGPMTTVLLKILNISRLPAQKINEHQRTFLEKELKGLRVEVMHLGYPRKYVIKAITQEAVSELTFEDQGRSKGVKEYFEQKCMPFFQKSGQRINPCLPCIKTNNGAYLPLEVCYLVPHQRRTKNLPESILAEMTRQSAMMSAVKRFDCIAESKNIVMNDGREYLEKFGIQVAVECMKITGRMLPLPELMHQREGREMALTPRSTGSWRMSGRHFYIPVKVIHWIVVTLTDNVETKHVADFLKRLIQVASSVGIFMNMPCEKLVRMKVADVRGRLSEMVFQKARSKVPNLQLILFILPKNSELYEEVKHAGDVLHGIPTQCVAEERFVSVRRGAKEFPPLVLNDDYLCNLLQKVNTRLGGINTCLSPNSRPKELDENTMIVGIDASHPAPGDKLSRSVAACVASIDKHCAQYVVSVRAQEPFVKVKTMKDDEEKSKLVEEIVKLDEMMESLLKKYAETNKRLPSRIIIFRDGVSDGQFSTVFQFEIVALKHSFAKFGTNFNPKLTMIIVQKRHHTRFLPDARRSYQSDLKSGNIMPGTCVDDFITSQTLFDYYLCSHEGALGTSRPARYCVLYDEASMSADVLQQITYYLCFVYGRCLKPISIPAPVGYAHLASKKAREHLKCEISQRTETSLVTDQKAIDTTNSMTSNKCYFI